MLLEAIHVRIKPVYVTTKGFFATLHILLICKKGTDTICEVLIQEAKLLQIQSDSPF